MATTSSPIEIAEGRHKGWGWFDYAVIDQYGARIGADGIAVYIALARFADNSTRKSFPATATLAERTGLSDRQVKRVLALLAEVGLITITRQFDDEGRQRTNLYTLETVPPMQETVGRGDTQSPSGVTHSQGEGDTQSPKQDSVNKTHRNKREPVPLRYDAADDNPPTHRLVSVSPPYRPDGAIGDISLISPVACESPGEPEVTIAVPPTRPRGTAIKPGAKGTPPRLPELPLPDVYPLTPEMAAWAAAHPKVRTLRDLPTEHEQFCAHYWSRGNERRTNWLPQWERWMVDQATRFKDKSAPSGPAPPREAAPNADLDELNARRRARAAGGSL